MRTLKKLFAAFAVLILLLPCSVFAAPNTVSSTELIEKSKEYSGKTIEFVGEVIGDVMIRGDHAWVNINDGSNAIGIWMTAEQASKIKHLGSYDFQGDEVRAVGVFERACKEHGGDMDIHADSIDVIKSGYRMERPANHFKGVAAIVLFGLSAAFAIIIISRRI